MASVMEVVPIELQGDIGATFGLRSSARLTAWPSFVVSWYLAFNELLRRSLPSSSPIYLCNLDTPSYSPHYRRPIGHRFAKPNLTVELVYTSELVDLLALQRFERVAGMVVATTECFSRRLRGCRERLAGAARKYELSWPTPYCQV